MMLVLFQRPASRRRPRMVKVKAGIEKVKEDYSQIIPPEAMVGNCRRIGHQFRQRKCGPIETFYLFLI